jgi:hypothetical protein
MHDAPGTEGEFRDESLRYVTALAALDTAIDRLLAWRRARPFLFDGQTPYARSLLKTILDSYLQCCRFEGVEPDEKIIRLIHQLMNGGPPPKTPPSTKARRKPGFAFYMSFQYITGTPRAVFFLGPPHAP